MLAISGQANEHFQQSDSKGNLRSSAECLKNWLNSARGNGRDVELLEGLQLIVEKVDQIFDVIEKRDSGVGLTMGIRNLHTMAQNTLIESKYENYLKRAEFLKLVVNFLDQAAVCVDQYDYADFRDFPKKLQKGWADTQKREAKGQEVTAFTFGRA